MFGKATQAWFDSTFPGPTEVQKAGWPHIKKGEHTLLLAPTGSGKTLAAFLSCLDRLAGLAPDAPEGVRVLYVSPLKALVYDIERNLRAPLVGIHHAATALDTVIRPIRVDMRTGDTSQRDRRHQAKHPGDILVTTPESLYLLLTSNARETLRTVETVIIDEIHVMAGTKRGAHLALTLERLAALCDTDPQRVGLSATQRPLELIAKYMGGDRDVSIVDASASPEIDLSIVVPVKDMNNPIATVLGGTGDGERQLHSTNHADKGPLDANPSGKPTVAKGIWPTIYPRLLELIRAHTSTIIFTNSRLLCERLSQRLNELAGEDLVRAHHGSISHEQRHEVEEALKSGTLPCIVATSSLELGIDMGAVDLVVLVESPGSVASGLQRVGRAGHHVGGTSIGRIFPKYRGDLLEAAVVSQHMLAGRIESTRVPKNCLDVLAQHIVGMVAMDDYELAELERIVKRAFPFSALTHDVLVSVLDMLSGRYPSDDYADLSPRVNWDRATDQLTARRGARMLAVLNPGTIPDRGLYGVFLPDGPRLGELDEEMVYESRKGDNIILGATTWKIQDITRDRVVVTPAPGEPGRLPFWHGERPGRPVEVGKALGAFLRELTEKKGTKRATAWLQKVAPLDEYAAGNLLAYVDEQREATGIVPTDRTIAIESFRDELGDWRVCLLSPFGSRVHAPWGLALESLLSARAGFDVQVMWSDDGIVVRFADSDELPDLDVMLPDPDEVEDLVVEQLRYSALFAARFRENAARALLLPRRRAKGRTPLWQQRLKAQNLMAVASRHPAFPIILETYRECLQDVFDLPGLKEILGAIRRREIKVEEVETRSASPFARSLVFQYVAAYLYDGDAPLAERKAQALALDRNLLRELLGQEELRDLLDVSAVDEVEQELQWLAADRLAQHADALHDRLRRLGDLSRAEIDARCEGDAGPWLDELLRTRRAIPIRVAGESRWIAAEDAARYRDALGVALPTGVPRAFLDPVEAPLESLLLRYAKTHIPFLTSEIAARFGLLPAQLEPVLRGLLAVDKLLHGELRPGGTRREWCDPDVLRRLRRRTLARLRKEVAPVEPDVHARFLVDWHKLGSRRGGLTRLEEVLDQLEGLPLPASVLERDILSARMPDFAPRMLDELGAMGSLVWIGRGPLGPRDGRVALYRRERVPLLVDPPEPLEGAGRWHEHILEVLGSRGACFLLQLQHPDCPARELETALWDLVWAGLVTNDTFAPLRALKARRKANRRGRRPVSGGRWSLVTDLIGPGANDTEKAHARTIMLLERYGVVSREAAHAENLPGGFSSVYPVLRAMEETGRVRRGYFVEGLTGAQFAMPGAVDRLRSHRTPEEGVQILAAVDPANAWGALLPWPGLDDKKRGARPKRVAGGSVVSVGGKLALFRGSSGRTWFTFPAAREDQAVLKAAFAAFTDGTFKSVRVEKIDGAPALQSPAAPLLLTCGFAEDYKGLVYARGAY